MTYALSLFQKFGFFAPKADATDDAFSHRLSRIGTRDARHEVRAALFIRNPA
ncbi:MAG: hypothetical protein ACK4HF_10245 [Paracoccaceae bacterium]